MSGCLIHKHSKVLNEVMYLKTVNAKLFHFCFKIIIYFLPYLFRWFSLVLFLHSFSVCISVNRIIIFKLSLQ